MYLVPEDTIKKFREENQLNSLLDTEMNKIIKMKISDSKKWYMYRQILMKAAKGNRSDQQNNTQSAITSTQTDVFPEYLELYKDDFINDYSMMNTPQPFRGRASTHQVQITPEDFLKRSDSNLKQQSSFSKVFQQQETPTNEEIIVIDGDEDPTTTDKKKKIVLKKKRLFNPLQKSTPQPSVGDFYGKKIKNLKILDIPLFKAGPEGQSGKGKRKFVNWINFK